MKATFKAFMLVFACLAVIPAGSAFALCTHPAQTAADPVNFPCDGSGGQNNGSGVEFGGEVPPPGAAPGPSCEDMGLTQPDQSGAHDSGVVMAAVAQAVAELTAEGADLTGDNCGQIVERAIQYIPGAGLLFKDWGANYNGHSIDVIVFEDGYAYDVVGSCGEANSPAMLDSCCVPPGMDPPFSDPTQGLCTDRRIAP